jgi:hypothetical protein
VEQVIDQLYSAIKPKETNHVSNTTVTKTSISDVPDSQGLPSQSSSIKLWFTKNTSIPLHRIEVYCHTLNSIGIWHKDRLMKAIVSDHDFLSNNVCITTEVDIDCIIVALTT